MLMRHGGYTLIEVMIVMVVLTTTSLGLYNINLAMTRSSVSYEQLTTLHDEGRLSLQHIERRLRMAEGSGVMANDLASEAWSALGIDAKTRLQFQMAADMDGNGYAINQDYSLSLSDPIVCGADSDDANGDGLTDTQLVVFDASGAVTKVLSNHLASSNGILFQRVNSGIQVSLMLRHNGGGTVAPSTVQMRLVVPTRN